MNGDTPPAPGVIVEPAPESQRAVLANLLQLYLHDFSEFDGRDAGADGLYPYPYLPFYWSERGRWPFLIRAGGQLAGFALVRDDAGTFEMAEFFVMRKFRRQGVGEDSARQIFLRFPGPWQVSQLAANQPAIAFWRRVIGNFAGDFREEAHAEGPIQRFLSPCRP